jgi:hypothetical protein
MSNEQYPQNPFKDYESGGIAFAGCILLGIGIAWIIKPIAIPAGALIGAGVGFIAMAIISRDK